MKNNTCQAIVKEWTKFSLNWMLIVQVLWELLQQGSDEDVEDKRGQGAHSASAGGRRSHCKFTSLMSPYNNIDCDYVQIYEETFDLPILSSEIICFWFFSDLRRDIGQVCWRVWSSLQPGELSQLIDQQTRGKLGHPGHPKHDHDYHHHHHDQDKFFFEFCPISSVNLHLLGNKRNYSFATFMYILL